MEVKKFLFKRRRIRQTYTGLLVSLLICLQSISSYADWHQFDQTWRYEQEGTYLSSMWVKDLTGHYYLDENGVMSSGWKLIDQQWYFLNPISNGSKGNVLTGWQWIDGKCYYFSEKAEVGYHLGTMYANGVTPDGYMVSTSGAWIDDAGKEILIPGKGIQTTISQAVNTVSRSGGGGGGSSFGGGGSRPPIKPPIIPDEGDEEDDIIETPVIPPEDEEDDFIPDEDNPEISTPSDATPSDAEMVNWKVHFVDKDTYQIKLMESRNGKIKDGEALTVNYRTKIVDAQNRIWEAIDKPPAVITVYGPGDQSYYIEYIQTGTVPEEADPFEEEKIALQNWLIEAKQLESLITGESTTNIPDKRIVTESQAQNDERLLTLAGHIEDTQEYIVYVIGKNMVPVGTILTDIYREEIEYSNLVEAMITIEEDVYTISRFAITRHFNEENCQHEWSAMEQDATCLRKGRQIYQCERCGLEETVIQPPMGHEDQNQDSVCDRCNTRAFPQELGSVIQIEISIEGGTRRKLEFVCMDEDYQDGMLYVSKNEIPVSDFGGYGDLQYQASLPARYFISGWQNACSIAGDLLLPIKVDGVSAYAAILSQDEANIYQPTLGNYLTRSLHGSGLAVVKADGSIEETNPEAGVHGIRPVVLLKKPDPGVMDRMHWNIGDVQAREIEGETYLFRCIDQNYSDKTETHKQAALFLCDSVIGANTGSKYIFEHHNYVFQPGPIVNFGTSSDYKYSNIRKWLQQSTDNFYGTEDINIGVSYAYTGSTGEGKFSQLNESALNPYYIGNQKMADQVFILSVDEAIKYREWLWKFDGSDIENPETQYGAFKKGYWLRNPMGTAQNGDTGFVYMVDLVRGNIRPMENMPKGGSGDAELDVTGTTGVRPVFTMPQG